MILKGSQRGGALALAAHLLNARDNEHIEVAAINGFISDTIEGAFQEAHAASLATSCKQFLFSLSLSPPEDAVVGKQDFHSAIAVAMDRVGLAGQPHVVIYHEKNGRRHAHLVVSRIDGENLKAINLPFYKERLCDLSRELFLTHQWKLPKGHVDRALSDPLNYSLEEHQVAKRAKRDPKELKQLLKECWTQSDSKASFIAALEESDFRLCRGDRRAFVALDREGNIYSLSRWLGVKTKELSLRLGDPDELPSIENTLQEFERSAGSSDDVSTSAETDLRVARLDARIAALIDKKSELINTHRLERRNLRQAHDDQKFNLVREFKRTQSSLRHFWSWVVGKRTAIVAERQAVLDTFSEKQELEALALSNRQRIAIRNLRGQIADLSKQREAFVPQPKSVALSTLIQRPSDPDALLNKQQIRKQPDYVLQVITDKKANFYRNDILRTLSRYFDDPNELRTLSSQALRSSELLRLDGGSEANPRFTTQSFRNMETRMFALAETMAKRKAYGVQPKHVAAAIHRQNIALQKSAGATLSDEQRNAIEHVVNRRQLSAIVGLAGAGKSTLLSAANHAWTAQGYRVLGAALAGKAADGLQSASGIPSRTLASWELGWKHGRNPIQAGDILVIDEAGMVGSVQLSRIIKVADESGAKLVLVGDPDQLQPINAGTPFRVIADKIGFAELSEIRRQRDSWQKKASLDLARGRVVEAIQSYEDHGAVEYAHNTQDAIAALVEDYMVDYELNGDTETRLALAHRRMDVFTINQAIRAAKKSTGELTNENVYKTNHGLRAFAPGDRILFTKNDHDLGVRNGMLGRVHISSTNELTVRLDCSDDDSPEKCIVVKLNQYDHIDHGYAVTIHKSQGATVDNVFVLRSRGMDHHLDYVAYTRHRRNAKIYCESFVPSNKMQSIKSSHLSVEAYFDLEHD